ncbi:cocaine- and amphetamine-regulated transcript protein-like isoform X1 [Poecilia reticulata]|uniref:cocaine- and amphetamine-regulated transcript protein-like isoform X1 n=1 Tax=Poecilia reticulata TaxID=8081 RepID=UPI0007EBE7A4|nr:PREDICTED: cocaine- and amphetamine-regulated transcript protein-like isoform X1 [Poecilia reticulata]
MVNASMLLLSAACWLLVALGRCDERLEERSPEYDVIKTEEEKELIEALQEVLEKLKNKQLPSSEKKLGWLPPVSSASPADTGGSGCLTATLSHAAPVSSVRCVKERGSGSCVDVPEERCATSASCSVHRDAAQTKQ